MTLSALSYIAAVSLLCGGNRRLDGCYRENPVALERRRARSFVEKDFVDSNAQSEVAFAFCHLLGTVRLIACLKRREDGWNPGRIR